MVKPSPATSGLTTTPPDAGCASMRRLDGVLAERLHACGSVRLKIRSATASSTTSYVPAGGFPASRDAI